MEHVRVGPMYAAAAASGLWEGRWEMAAPENRRPCS